LAVYNLIASINAVDPSGPVASLTLNMPIADIDGNALSDGTELSIVFGDAVTALTLAGVFRNTPPTSASAGQVLNFRYSINTNSWWNA
jgi:hypothetical protein